MHAADLPAPFLGRERERSLIRRVWSALPDRGCVVHLSGPPGIGKTALLRACAEDALAQGLQVVRAVGSRAEQALPFATLHQLLRPLLAGVEQLPFAQRAALLGAFGVADLLRPAEPAHIGLAALELLSESAVGQPLLAIVDDLQWADPASREAIDFVSRRLAAEPAVLLVATREAPPRTASAGDEHDPLHLPLTPLETADARALLTRHAPALPDDHRDRVLETAQGNPLALLELSASVRASPPGAALALTDRLRHAFADRLEECGPAARAVLLVAAIQDSDRLDEAERAAQVLLGRPVGDGDRRDAARSGLVEIDGEALRFRHPLMCSAVIDHSTPQAVAAAHGALAHVLAADPDRSAWHHACALQEPDSAVADALEASADRALARGAPSLAQTILERSAQLSPQQDVSGHRLLRAAEVAFELGRPDTVRALLEQVRARPLLPEDSGRVSALETAFDDGVPGGERLVRQLQQAAAEAVRAGDSELAVSLLIRASRSCYWGATCDTVLLGRLRSVADEVRLAPGDSRPVLVDAFLSPFARGALIVDHLKRWTAGSDSDPALTGLLAMAGFVSGSFEHSLPLTLAAETGLRQQGRLAALTQVLVLRTFAALYLGRWDVSATAADEALRFAEETGQTTWAACARLGLANVAAIRGRHRLAMRLLGEVQQAAVVSGNVGVANGMQLTRGLAAFGQEDPGLAYDEFARMLDPADPVYQSPQCAWALDYYAEAAHGAGRQGEARAVVRQVEKLAQGTPAGGVQRALALAHALLAEDDEAQDRFAQARLHLADGSTWYRARLDLAEGAWLRRHRRIAEGRELLRAAQRAFDLLDVPAWGARAAREVAATGQSAERRRPGRWASLSPQELEIARLAGQGLSNREIGERLYLSHRTVGSHLYRLFPKLGVQSRGQLAAALAESEERE
ncbi:AAA family ATPase [Streptomyces griseorubiginosus]|uniref:AAA family ATPase n=1 Tax=Streptomyces griseorubiginosus TaxID=67304 RepID=UPI001AD64372|nr:LuxR family transcriptional regulator [Streptomyces griseorubiginosus]MBO4252441.1 AAA family ATPase [Streptomyces griseorubiginosus]